MRTLTIKLTAPLQAYGNDAHFARRTTNDYPTKSAVIGMIAAALGYKRTDSRIIPLNKLSFATRIDQPGQMLNEFQTVEWKKDTRKLTYREYLQDAVFVVAIGGEVDQISAIQYALMHPRFSLFLGRRSNPPAGVLRCKFFDDMDPVTALQQLPWQAATWFQRQEHNYEATIIADATLLPGHRSWMVRDHVLSFDQRSRQYSFREISQIGQQMAPVTKNQTISKTTHNIFDQL
ncbi:type I-E CRISPR-associated protein Cas5/CasD [Loigolactobacillus coryniformis]|uniref:Type I-E CRISPR-associated protein Cas5/CasD n=1 Tax=Loigolactobacillus coryniformis TaxID=1610 RepID=A0A5B8TLX3_9LACO|nr:type I-E CRISPR-associated protein Cas5/CasD [Loigolactobacillus coryniformis]MBW4802939.1 type I-E CRISPR-associated protein Cas5/CasD [Loigolactobacillus coryniformis subsp. torquens]MBW4805635.1 type I-E CRISPR-associated protein Cas5/CasD [Loigolactobacillus coryniformis subsp. torquens]QEA53401.1 type I-E CRISPR-associated protein Cas5/CasD [Loigolactobacillus coryniformis]RRG01462.1 MAG: type I-E CRISPR-associated protein Cas5/CasD [Lactobacillus sp.]